MALLEALSSLSEIGRFSKRYDDDFVDRLHTQYSPVMFFILGVFVSTKEYVGDPISCFVPHEFTLEWTDYTNRLCWINNKYYLPVKEDIPEDELKRNTEIAYYQWVPLMIFLQAMLLYAPSLIWEIFNSQSGIYVNKIVSMIDVAEHGNAKVRAKAVKFIVLNLDRTLCLQREYRTGGFARCRQNLARDGFPMCGKRYGNYLVSLYLSVKLLYIATDVGQLILLNAFLGDNYYVYGWEVMMNMYKGGQWGTSKRFPRVTMCDFYIRSLGDRVHEYTVQCALPINLFNEKIFLFMWFWLVFISAATIVNFVMWIWTLFGTDRRQYACKYLKILHKNSKLKDNKPSKEFYEDYLRQDGIFLLRLIAKNTNDLEVGEIIQAMWNHYKKEQKEQSDYYV